VAHTFKGGSRGVIDLGALPGLNSSHPNAINDVGSVAGQSQNGKFDPILHVPEYVAVAWVKGKIERLPALDGTLSFALELSQKNSFIGFATNKIPYTTSVWGNLGTEQRAVLWLPGKKVKDLGTLGGPSAAAYYVNSQNIVVGQSLTNNKVNVATGIPTSAPFLWKKGHRMQNLGTLGGRNGSALFIDDRGHVAGQSDLKGDKASHAFAWTAATGMKDLGTLGGNNSSAIWMNDYGDVAGYADLPGSTTHHATLWRNGKVIDLGVFKGKTCSRAVGINSKDQVVGESNVCGNDSTRVPLLWQNGHMTDLNTLISPPASGLRLMEGLSINDRGDIAVEGRLPNGHEHIVILVPRK
jgi:probable HAF family extracellular repeat protein